MTKEDLEDVFELNTQSEIIVASKLFDDYSLMLTIHFFLIEHGTRLNSSTCYFLESLKETFGTRALDFTVRHNKKSKFTIEQEEKALKEFFFNLNTI